MELANRAMDDRNFVIKALDALDLLAVSASDTTNETINKRWSLLKYCLMDSKFWRLHLRNFRDVLSENFSEWVENRTIDGRYLFREKWDAISASPTLLTDEQRTNNMEKVLSTLVRYALSEPAPLQSAKEAKKNGEWHRVISMLDEEFIASLNDSLKIKAYSIRVEAHEALSDFAQAINDCNEILPLIQLVDADSLVHTYRRLGVIFMKKLQYLEALKCFQLAKDSEKCAEARLALDNESNFDENASNVNFLEGKAKFENKDFAAASFYLQNAVALNPTNSNRLIFLAKVYYDFGKYSLALDTIDSATILLEYLNESTFDALLLKYNMLLSLKRNCSLVIDRLRMVAPNSAEVRNAVKLYSSATMEMIVAESTVPDTVNVEFVYSTDSLLSLDIAICPVYRHSDDVLPFRQSFHGHHAVYALSTLKSCARAFTAREFTEHTVGIQEVSRIRDLNLESKIKKWRHPDDQFNSHAKFAIDASSADNMSDDEVRCTNSRVITERTLIRQSFANCDLNFDTQAEKFAPEIAGSLRCFPVKGDIRTLYHSISVRGGKPKLIVLFAHGNQHGMEAGCNCTYNCITAPILVDAIQQFEPMPSGVVLFGCNTHAIASAAHALCPQVLWLGSVAKLARIDMFSGNAIVPRWLRRLHEIAITLRLQLPSVKMFLRWLDRNDDDDGAVSLLQWRTTNLCADDVWSLFLAEMIDQIKQIDIAKHVKTLLYPGSSSQTELESQYTLALKDPKHSLWRPLKKFDPYFNNLELD